MARKVLTFITIYLSCPLSTNSFHTISRSITLSKQQQQHGHRSISSRTTTFAGSTPIISPASPQHDNNVPSRSRITTGTLSMHMGHSHSHSHSHNDHQQQQQPPPLVPISPKRFIRIILFSTLTTLFLPTILRRSIHRLTPLLSSSPLASFTPPRPSLLFFTLTTLTLTLTDSIRLTVRRFLTLTKRFRLPSSSSPSTKTTRKNTAETRAADRVTFVGVAINLILTALKALAGTLCHSTALIADAGHSLSDLVSDFVTLWAVRIGRLPPDDDFPYGHGKFEAVGSLFLSLLLLGAGVGIGGESYKRLWGVVTGGVGAAVEVPTKGALAVALVSVLSKEWLYRVTREVGERIRSPVIVANAWHHRSDAYSSVLALGSIAVAMTVPGLLAVDSAAGLLVAGMICTTGAEILFDSVKQLTDMADEELISSITTVLNDEVKQQSGTASSDVINVGRVRARQVGSHSLVDVTVTLAHGLSSSATRAIEERLRWKIMKAHPGVMDVDVHGMTNAICPLLIARESDERGVNVQKSTAEMESDVRGSLEDHPNVKGVSEVMIHYHDNMLVDVDATVRLGDGMTMPQATKLVRELKELLKDDHQEIINARIFLDLNNDAELNMMDDLATSQQHLETLNRNDARQRVVGDNEMSMVTSQALEKQLTEVKKNNNRTASTVVESEELPA